LKALISFFLSFFFSFSVFAVDLNLACMTETPTTTLVVQTKNGIVQFDLYHHFGVKYMPIHSGVITPNDLGTLSDRASLLADLGDHLTFTIPSDSCQMDGMIFNCFGSQPASTIGGHKVSFWSAYSTTYDEVSSAGIYSYVTTNLGIEVDGQTLFLPMKYFGEECYKEFSANQKFKKLLK
jgi:hypothetical protein